MTFPGGVFPPEALWIGSDHPFDLHEAYLDFRSPASWRLEKAPEQADLYITADSRYKLWINGDYVKRGPARCYPKYQSVDLLDITSHLRPGPNTIAVQVYQPGYSHFAYVFRGAAGLLLCLLCDGRCELVTDTAWRVHRDPSFAANAPRVSIYGTGVEVRDMRLADDWQQVGFDDAGWAPARTVGTVGAYPWTNLTLRSLPLLEEEIIERVLLETRRGVISGPVPEDVHLALRLQWAAATPAPSPESDDGWVKIELGEGETAFWLYDLGRDYTCQGLSQVEHALGSETISISYAEKLRDGELVLSDPADYCRVRMTDSYKLRRGSQALDPFSMRGGRYLLVQITGPTGPEFRFRPRVRISSYPLATTRPLTTSDPLLNDIIAMCETTFRACLQDGFVDSVWRESSQWLGDALPQALIMSSLSDDTRPLRRVIEMAAQGAYPDGVLPSVLPGEVHAYAIVDYNFMWVELLDLYGRLSGDDDFIESMLPTLVKMLDRFHQDVDSRGLIISQPGRRLFLDWAPLSRKEPSAVYNLHYLLALQVAARLAHEQQVEHLAQRWRARADDLQAAIRRAFWGDGRWYDDLEQATYSQLAAALALLTGSTRPAEIDPQLDAIIARSLDPDDIPAPGRMVLASPFMHHYLFEALRRFGRDQAVVGIIAERWGRWARAGYPTTWENWNVDFPDGSQCHAFSAHPRYQLSMIYE